MTYQSEADHWRNLFEQQKDICITQTIQHADMRVAYELLMEETLRTRIANRKLWVENTMLRHQFIMIAIVTIAVTTWNIL